MTIDDRIRRAESFLVANDGQYLGRLTLNQFAAESISNPYGIYGSRYSAKSIRNEYSVYGSRFSALSPYNQYTMTPPKIFLNGCFWGVLTTNGLLYSINKLTPSDLNSWMQQNGLFY